MNAVPATPWPLHIFAFLLFPMACWQLWLFPGIPNYYAQHFLIYPSLVFMLWAWKRGLWTLAEAWRLARPFFPWLLLLVILQIVADWRSARFFLPEGAPMWRSIATSLIKLGAQLPFILFFILLWRVLLRDAYEQANASVVEYAIKRGSSANMHMLYLKQYAGYRDGEAPAGEPVLFVGEEEG
mgnify:CR=1 FL=1